MKKEVDVKFNVLRLKKMISPSVKVYKISFTQNICHRERLQTLSLVDVATTLLNLNDIIDLFQIHFILLVGTINAFL